MLCVALARSPAPCVRPRWIPVLVTLSHSCPLTPSCLFQLISCPGPHHAVPSRYFALDPLSISSWLPYRYPGPHPPIPVHINSARSLMGISSQSPSQFLCPSPHQAPHPDSHTLSWSPAPHPALLVPRFLVTSSGAPAGRVKGHCWEGDSPLLALLGGQAVLGTGGGCMVTRLVASTFCFLST